MNPKKAKRKMVVTLRQPMNTVRPVPAWKMRRRAGNIGFLELYWVGGVGGVLVVVAGRVLGRLRILGIDRQGADRGGDAVSLSFDADILVCRAQWRRSIVGYRRYLWAMTMKGNEKSKASRFHQKIHSLGIVRRAQCAEWRRRSFVHLAIYQSRE